jgi:uncharacterized protein (DUF433 family)
LFVNNRKYPGEVCRRREDLGCPELIDISSKCDIIDWRTGWTSAKIRKKDSHMDWKNRIVVDEKILGGKPVVRGTRLAVEFIMDLLAQEWAEKDILRNYPSLTHEDIVACYWYAGEFLKTERVFSVVEDDRVRMRPLPTKS